MKIEHPDRPNCSTCPFWNTHGFDRWHGECRKNAPSVSRGQLPSVDMTENEFISNLYMAHWPQTRVETLDPDMDMDGFVQIDWCGEHPDFARWIESRKQA